MDKTRKNNKIKHKYAHTLKHNFPLSKHSSSTNQTNKKVKRTVQGRYIGEKEGWEKVEIYGSGYEMGYAHGALLASQIKYNLKLLSYIVKEEFKVDYPQYVKKCEECMLSIIQKDYPEIYEEMMGISDGASHTLHKTHISVSDILAWNAYLSMSPFYENHQMEKEKEKEHVQRCSAFIATGKATSNGEIVMAHNTHCHYALGSVSNIIMYVSPSSGHGFCMQTCAGLICSSMDWFMTTAGIVGCETTIAGTTYLPEFGAPYFCRIRRCMQYGNSLDDYSKIMTTNNAGDYPCSWLFGDVNSNEIMMCELGKQTHSIQRTKNGVYYGSNYATNMELRALETDTQNIDSNVLSQFSRFERLEYLLLDKYKGKINLSNSKTILADHYDSFLDKVEMSSRTICKHSELDDLKRYPGGAVDGKVLDSSAAKKMEFWGRFGSSCGRQFHSKTFMKHNPKHKSVFLMDLPHYRWTKLKN